MGNNDMGVMMSRVDGATTMMVVNRLACVDAGAVGVLEDMVTETAHRVGDWYTLSHLIADVMDDLGSDGARLFDVVDALRVQASAWAASHLV